MNQSKKNNGWILCPSKTFPGKFYYFNVLNGETAWSLNEIGNNTLRRDDGIHTITDKSHSYPEPNSPPMDESPDTSISISTIKKPNLNLSALPQRVIHNAQVPMFGQATFPKYVQQAPYMPNIIWTPIQLPPMIPQPTIMSQPTMIPQAQMMPQPQMMPSTMLPQPPVSMASMQEVPFKKCNFSDHTLIVQTCSMPLSKRFAYYSKHTQGTHKDVGKFHNTSTPLQNKNNRSNDKFFSSFENLNINQNRPLIKEPVFKRARTQSESKQFETKSVYKSNSLESLVNSDNLAVHKPTFLGNHVGNPNSLDKYSIPKVTDGIPSHFQTTTNKLIPYGTKKMETTTFQDLDENDLRFLLVAKRRSHDERPQDLGVPGKKIKTSRTENQVPTAKKRVTFSLGVEDSITSVDSEQGVDDYPEEFDITQPYDAESSGFLYVVSDLETLLDDLQCIEDYVQADDKRRLVISDSLRTQVEATSRGDCGGRQRVMVARQLARKIAAPPLHYVILPQTENAQDCSVVENYTLNCCLDIINSDDDMIVITNNSQLYEEAKSLNVNCFTTQEIKDGAGATKPELSFELKKIQMPVNNKSSCVNDARSRVNDITGRATAGTRRVNNETKRVNDFMDHATDGNSLVNNENKRVDDVMGRTANVNIRVNDESRRVNVTGSASDVNSRVNDDNKRVNVTCRTTDGKSLVNNENKRVNDFTGRTTDGNSRVNDERVCLNAEKKKSNLVLQSAYDLQSFMKTDHITNAFLSNSLKENSVRPGFQTRNQILEQPNTLNDEGLIKNTGNLTKKDRRSIFDIENGTVETALENLSINKKQKCSEQTFRYENESEFERTKEVCGNENTPVNAKQQVCVNNAFEFTQNVTRLNETDLDECLKSYFVDNKDVAKLINLRMDELVCVFTQIVENALVDVLTKHFPITDKLTPPWVLYEATKNIQNLYGSHTELKIVAEKFRELLAKETSESGKLKPIVKPNYFMRIFGCGNILIQTLKEILPDHQELVEADTALKKLLRDITQPIEDPPPIFLTPVVKRCDVDEQTDNQRRNFVKKTSEIVEYLKKHYPAWKNVEIPQEASHGPNITTDQPKVVRTFGRNLNLLNIDKTKTITIKNPTGHTHDKITFENTKNSTKTNQNLPTNMSDIICEKLPKPAKTTKMVDLESLFGNPRREPMVLVTKFNFDNLKITKKVSLQSDSVKAPPINVDDLNVPKNSNTFNQETAGPKVIRPFEKILKTDQTKTDFVNNDIFNPQKSTAGSNMMNKTQQINTFEEKFKNKPIDLDLDALDYTGNDENLSPETDENMANNETRSIDESVSFVYEIKDIKRNINSTQKTNFIIESDDNALNNDLKNYTSKALTNDCQYENAFTKEAENKNGLMISALDNDKANATFCNDSIQLVDENNTKDSGIENESLNAYSLVKSFLIQLSASFKNIYQFIDKTIIEFREEDVQEEKRLLLHHKANTSHLLIAGIIDKLKSIIQRESDDVSVLKEMLITAGVQASNDKRMTRYRQVVTKCLEQALMLQAALKTMLTLTDKDLDTLSAISAQDDVRYFNIFE